MEMYKTLVCMLLLASMVSAASNTALSDQGTNVRYIASGSLMMIGNLTVYIYDAATAGNLVYSEGFSDAIVNGSWNVMLGENDTSPLTLTTNQKYWKDYSINGEDVDFTNLTGGATERLFFYSPLGSINWTNLTDVPSLMYSAENTTLQALVQNNKSMNVSKANVGTCAVGEVVQNATATGVQCIAAAAGVGTLGSVENGTINGLVASNTSMWNNITSFNNTILALVQNNKSMNVTKANAGTCAAGDFVQNATATGVQCATPPAGIGTLGSIENATINALVQNNMSMNTSKANVGASASCTYGIANISLWYNSGPTVTCAAQQAGGSGTLGSIENGTINGLLVSNNTTTFNLWSFNSTFNTTIINITALQASNASIYQYLINLTTNGSIDRGTITALVNNNKSMNVSKANAGTCAAGDFVQNATATGVQCATPPAGVGTLGSVENGTINGLVVSNNSLWGVLWSFNSTFNTTIQNITALQASNTSVYQYLINLSTNNTADRNSIARLDAANTSLNLTIWNKAQAANCSAGYALQGVNNNSYNCVLIGNATGTLGSIENGTINGLLVSNNTTTFTLWSFNSTFNTTIQNITALQTSNTSVYQYLVNLSINDSTNRGAITGLVNNNKSLNETMTSWRSSSVGFTNTTGNISTTRNASFSAGITLTTSGTQPACNAAYRGHLWMNMSASGISDFLFACGKDSADAYGWALIMRWD